MRRHLLAVAALVPVAAAATALPADAQWAPVNAKNGQQVTAAAVSGVTAPGAYPMRRLRSSTQTCSGTVVYKKIALYNGKVAGELDVYYKSGTGGTLIACFKHAGVTLHKRIPTSVAIAGRKTATAKPGVAVVAYGNFISWAGPAVIGGMDGKCVQAAGAMKYMGKTIMVESPVLCDK